VDADELEELGARTGIFPKRAGHSTGNHGHTALVHPASGHALVSGIDDDTRATRLQHIGNAVRYLGG